MDEASYNKTVVVEVDVWGLQVTMDKALAVDFLQALNELVLKNKSLGFWENCIVGLFLLVFGFLLGFFFRLFVDFLGTPKLQIKRMPNPNNQRIYQSKEVMLKDKFQFYQTES